MVGGSNPLAPTNFKSRSDERLFSLSGAFGFPARRHSLRAFGPREAVLREHHGPHPLTPTNFKSRSDERLFSLSGAFGFPARRRSLTLRAGHSPKAIRTYHVFVFPVGPYNGRPSPASGAYVWEGFRHSSSFPKACRCSGFRTSARCGRRRRRSERINLKNPFATETHGKALTGSSASHNSFLHRPGVEPDFTRAFHFRAFRVLPWQIRFLG